MYLLLGLGILGLAKRYGASDALLLCISVIYGSCVIFAGIDKLCRNIKNLKYTAINNITKEESKNETEYTNIKK